ncbi:putative syntaxin-131 [Rutidosis leptorrhynchoides]|uniref:putative syntaxin-131 n=1 Tax=Rutidosis leptorrhynchoides TaxID=125765 RepID=UPI003A99A3AA
MHDAHEESKSITRVAAMKAIKQQMEYDVDEVCMVARFTKAKIEELDKENMTSRQKPGCGSGTVVDRSRTAYTFALKKNLKDKVTEFQDLRQSIHQEHRQNVDLANSSNGSNSLK